MLMAILFMPNLRIKANMLYDQEKNTVPSYSKKDKMFPNMDATQQSHAGDMPIGRD